ncbi:uncharacterized protein LOC113671815 [Paramuricea clavata]|uniref:Uncharacterized protein LOC113671815, partial n=1 Tax=Paramuricea clavata TaxID=317549 RepID=A0A6S7K4R6_PARCT|nr:uncharacterized protein LOC113671815 [Paramuricea clavata]
MSFTVCENSCQLNAGSRKLVKKSLRHKHGCRYYDLPPFKSTCDSSFSPPRLCCLPSSPLCYNGATCVVNVIDTTRRFQCQCPTGYYGNECQIKNPKTCLDYWTDKVKPMSGKYTLVDSSGKMYEIFCDFDSEEGMAWTLFESFDLNHHFYLHGGIFVYRRLSEKRA